MGKNFTGKKCPAFAGEATSGKTISNKDFAGKNLVVYFYPKDSTPGCTTEGQDFRDNYKSFLKANTENACYFLLDHDFILKTLGNVVF